MRSPELVVRATSPAGTGHDSRLKRMIFARLTPHHSHRCIQSCPRQRHKCSPQMFRFTIFKRMSVVELKRCKTYLSLLHCVYGYPRAAARCPGNGSDHSLSNCRRTEENPPSLYRRRWHSGVSQPAPGCNPGAQYSTGYSTGFP